MKLTPLAEKLKAFSEDISKNYTEEKSPGDTIILLASSKVLDEDKTMNINLIAGSSGSLTKLLMETMEKSPAIKETVKRALDLLEAKEEMDPMLKDLLDLFQSIKTR